MFKRKRKYFISYSFSADTSHGFGNTTVTIEGVLGKDFKFTELVEHIKKHNAGFTEVAILNYIRI